MFGSNVDSIPWYSWEPEAFAAAVSSNRLVFVWIDGGESSAAPSSEGKLFRHPDVDLILREYFVCIHVSTISRPDLARYFQIFVQGILQLQTLDDTALEESNFADRIFSKADENVEPSDPLGLWLTPSAKPFFGSTYSNRNGCDDTPRLIHGLERCAELWATQQHLVVSQSESLFAPWQLACGIQDSATENNDRTACSQHVDNS